MSTHEGSSRSIWRFRDKDFDTKLERDLYTEGWNDAVQYMEKRQKQFHIEDDV